MRVLKRVLGCVNTVTEYVVSVLLVIMVVVVFLQVIFRFVIHASLPWSEELSRYILVWLSFLGAAIGVRRGAHIGVEVVVSFLPKLLKKLAALFVDCASIVFFALMIFYGHRILAVVGRQLSPAMEWSMAVPYSAICAGGSLMLLYALEHALGVVAGDEGTAS
jgi:TRAP-type C4-dicarboxylate transport system permease small subunit